MSENEEQAAEPASAGGDLTRQNTGDHFHNVLGALLSTVPVVGSPLASLWDDYIPQSRMNRLRNFTNDLASALAALNVKAGVDYVRTDEFAFLWQEAYRGVAQSYQQEKVEAYKAILLNALLHPDHEQELKEYYLSLVASLSPLHIRLLRFISDPPAHFRGMNLPEVPPEGGFEAAFGTAFPRMPLDVIKSAFRDLHDRGLLNTAAAIPYARAPWEKALRLLGNQLTRLGRSFIAFCTLPSPRSNKGS